jgi:hypothetical protein
MMVKAFVDTLGIELVTCEFGVLKRVLGRQRLDSNRACTLFLLLPSTIP